MGSLGSALFGVGSVSRVGEKFSPTQKPELSIVDGSGFFVWQEDSNVPSGQLSLYGLELLL